MRCLVLTLLVVACSSPSTAPPPAPQAVVVAPAPPIDAASALADTFHCFAWIHGPQFSTDCYRSAALCETERKAMEAGARPTRPCEQVQRASCTMVGRRKMKKEERCFGDQNNCERYRAFVTGNGLDVTACSER